MAIEPYTILDARSHTLFEPYHYDTREEAEKAFNQMAIAALTMPNTRVLNLYEGAALIRTFTLVTIKGD